MQHAGATGNPQYIAPRAIYLSGKMNANTCLIGSSLVNNLVEWAIASHGMYKSALVFLN
jgi:hypothetical protein